MTEQTHLFFDLHFFSFSLLFHGSFLEVPSALTWELIQNINYLPMFCFSPWQVMKAVSDETETGRLITCLPSFIIHPAVSPLPSPWSCLSSVLWTRNVTLLLKWRSKGPLLISRWKTLLHAWKVREAGGKILTLKMFLFSKLSSSTWSRDDEQSATLNSTCQGCETLLKK